MKANRVVVSSMGLAFFVASAGAAAQDGTTWSDTCADIEARLSAAYADAPEEMAVGNRTKIERLLRDARVASDRSICVTKLERAHALIRMAYADAGADFEAIGSDR